MESKLLKKGYTFVIDNVTIRIYNESNIAVWSKAFGVYGSSISCGIKEMNSCPIDTIIDNLKPYIKLKATPEALVEEIFKQLITETKQRNNSAMILMSNNTGCPKFNKILDSLALIKHGYVRNPNSGSQIRLWVL